MAPHPRCPAPRRRLTTSLLTASLLAGGWLAQPLLAADQALEREQLAALVRQLEQLERQTRHTALLAQPDVGRYHFDYERLKVDLARVRAGITDYLTPSRAQPREPLPLHGHYGLESTNRPESSP
jgi:RAQPRD family integrative conjugative element protein